MPNTLLRRPYMEDDYVIYVLRYTYIVTMFNGMSQTASMCTTGGIGILSSEDYAYKLSEDNFGEPGATF